MDVDILTVTFESPLSPGEHKVTFTYAGTINNNLVGFYRSQYTTASGEKKFLAATQVCGQPVCMGGYARGDTAAVPLKLGGVITRAICASRVCVCMPLCVCACSLKPQMRGWPCRAGTSHASRPRST